MRAVFLTAAAFSALLTAFAAPTVNVVPVGKHAGPVKANSYIMYAKFIKPGHHYLTDTLLSKLKDGVSKDSHIAKLLSSTSDSKIEYKYEQVFHGYAAELKGKDLDYVRQSSDVEYILEDGIFTIQYE
jgi:hypothetical protein